MVSKLGYFIDNIKNVKPAIIVNAIMESSKVEVKGIVEKFSQVEQKTNAEIEKVVAFMVEKILKGKSKDAVPDDVKKEIVQKLARYNKGKNLLPIITYVNKTILANVPKNVKSAKSFKSNVANTLIKDAKKRLEGKKVAATY
ncbi:MAG: hypothetical protein V4591_10635 [Bdellovibrionota bacterium]